MRFFIIILACVTAAYGLAVYVSISANPEVRFWSDVVAQRDLDIAAVRTQSPDVPIVFFTGGSSCAFSIDPKIIEDTCGLPSFNVGLPVAAGREYLIHQALALTRAGDILVLCLEPDLLTNPTKLVSPSRLSLAISATAGNPSDAAGGITSGKSPSIPDYLNLSRPGASHIATLIGKTISNKGYRYTASDLRYRGRIETQIHANLEPVGLATATQLNSEGKKLLETLLQAASRRHVRVVYSMPWHFTKAEYIDQNRTNKLKILDSIRTVIPVIDDGFTGAISEADLFSDTGFHLSAKGSQNRSQALANVLKNWLLRQ